MFIMLFLVPFYPSMKLDLINLSIQQLTIHYQDCLIEFTVSIGGGIFTDKMPLTSMMEVVDKSLYIAKDKGKNKVVIN